MKLLEYDEEVFEVSRVHLDGDRKAEKCSLLGMCENDCAWPGVWAVYHREPDGNGGFRSVWLSDHSTEELARCAAGSYTSLVFDIKEEEAN